MVYRQRKPRRRMRRRRNKGHARLSSPAGSSGKDGAAVQNRKLPR